MEEDYGKESGDERKKHFQNALSNYAGVLNILGEWQERPHEQETFPQKWQNDCLSLLGQHVDWVELNDKEKCYYRAATMELIDRNGPEWVWENRMRLAAEIEFLRNF